jgi:hypothetical protein
MRTANSCHSVLTLEQVYRNQDLFGQFSAESQAIVQSFLEQSKCVLTEAQHLLQRELPETIRKLWWAFRDKERIEKIVKRFAQLNERLHEHVQLWCHATSLGLNRQHLKHLEVDDSSKQLGFDADARLQLLVTDNDGPQESLQIHDASVQACAERPLATLEKRFSVCQWNCQTVLLEYRDYALEGLGPLPIPEHKRAVVEKLAGLLHQTKETTFRTPTCIGWYIEHLKNRVALVFSLTSRDRSKTIHSSTGPAGKSKAIPRQPIQSSLYASKIYVPDTVGQMGNGICLEIPCAALMTVGS